MSLPSIIVIVVAVGDANDGTPKTLARSVQDSLGPEAIVVLREEPSIEDARIARVRDDLHADAVVVVRWTHEEGSPRAHLHVSSARSAEWRDRDVVFAATDPPEERARALGFGIASIVRVRSDADEKPPAAVESADTAPRPPLAVAAPPEGRRPRVAIDARFQGALAIGESGGGLGGEGAIGYRLAAPLAVRVFGGLRAGSVERAAASATYVRLGCGAAWTMIGGSDRGPLGIDARLDIGAVRVGLGRDDGSSNGARWTAMTVAALDFVWTASHRVQPVAAAGAEIAFERTEIFVDDQPATTVAPVRILAELGVRVGLD